jgi:acetyl esterase/lipase
MSFFPMLSAERVVTLQSGHWNCRFRPRRQRQAGLLTALVIAGSLSGADPKRASAPVPYNISLWEAGKVPLAAGDGPLDAPFLTAFLPPESKRNGTSVVVAPGGANIMLMYGAEGMEIAERLNDWGAAAFVLTYRLSPKYKEDARALDGNRAVQLVRARAAEWKLDPNKIGFAGFSAGSSMARAVVNAAKAPDPNAPDPMDRVSSRPDFLVMVYGPGRPTPGEDLKSFPPTFLLSAAADRGAAAGTVQLFQDMNRAGAVAELHIYQKGRHGFGGAFGSPEFSPWMDALRHFLQQGDFLPKGK